MNSSWPLAVVHVVLSPSSFLVSLRGVCSAPSPRFRLSFLLLNPVSFCLLPAKRVIREQLFPFLPPAQSQRDVLEVLFALFVQNVSLFLDSQHPSLSRLLTDFAFDSLRHPFNGPKLGQESLPPPLCRLPFFLRPLSILFPPSPR